MKRNWYLHLSNEIWVEFWDEITNVTISLKFSISTNNELINSEVRLLPKQPHPDSATKYTRKAGTDITKSYNSQLMAIDIRKINLLKIRQRALNIIFDYQELNKDQFNKVTNNKFNYPLSSKEASKIIKKIKHKKNSNEHLSIFSLLYVIQIHRGSMAPYAELSKSTSYSSNYIKNVIKQARKENYLSKPINKGIAGGALTPKSIRILSTYSS